MTIDAAELTRRRASDPGAIARAWAARVRAARDDDGRLLLIAADHPARGALGVRDRADAMASRSDLLDRIATALTRPGVDGVLATADILEDLLLAGLLDGKGRPSSSTTGSPGMTSRRSPPTASTAARC